MYNIKIVNENVQNRIINYFLIAIILDLYYSHY